MTDPSIQTIYTGRSTNWPAIRLSTALVLPLVVMAKGSDGLMLTLRTGPALRLTLTTGRKVTISTPDPAAAVQAINATRRGMP